MSHCLGNNLYYISTNTLWHKNQLYNAFYNNKKRKSFGRLFYSIKKKQGFVEGKNNRWIPLQQTSQV